MFNTILDYSKTKQGTFLKILVSLVLFAFLLQQIDFSSALSLLSNLSLSQILILYFFIIINIVLYAYSLALIARTSYLKTIFQYFYSWALGLVMPGKLGELAISKFLKDEKGISYKKAIAYSLIPKVFLFGFLCLASLYFFYLFSQSFFSETLFYILAFVILAFFLIVWKKDFFLEQLKKIGFDLKNFKFDFRWTIPVLVIAFLRFLVFGFWSYLAFLFLGYPIDFFTIILATAVSQTIVFLPISINGLGLREATFVSVLTLFAIPSSISSLVVILSLVLNYLLGALIFLYYSISKTSKYKAN